MQRVLAARSLRFVEQREEEAQAYQRQFKEAHAQAHGSRSTGADRRKGGAGSGGRHRSPHRGEEKEGPLLPGGFVSRRALRGMDLDPAGEPRMPLGVSINEFATGAPAQQQPSTGVFTLTYPDRPTSSGASYARQTGEKVAASQPLLGHSSSTGGKELSSSASASSLSNASSSNPSTSAASASSSSAARPHATVLVHEKKDKHDQLNIRIAAHMAAPLQKSMSALLVDEAVQRRLAKNQRKKAAVNAELAALRKRQAEEARAHDAAQRASLRSGGGSGSGKNAPPGNSVSAGGALDTLAALAAAGAHSGAGQGVWSSLGQRYVEQGGADLELPTLNTGVPLRELTRSKHPRPAPLKESSEHRKKYEMLVELFRAQRHRVIQPPLRDGQNGVPRLSSASGDGRGGGGGAESDSFSSSQLLASLGPGGLADLHPALTDLSTDSGSAVNPANQSLLARLYQTQATQKSINSAAAQAALQAAAQQAALKVAEEAIASGNALQGEIGMGPSTLAAPTRALSHSASAILPSRSNAAAAASVPGQGKDGGASGVGLTSIDRIAALAPRKWDASSIRPMASSASVPNFERRGPASLGAWNANKSTGPNGLVSLASLPEGHPAHMHPNVQPQPVSAAVGKQLAAEQIAREKSEYALAAQMLSASGAQAQVFGTGAGSTAAGAGSGGGKGALGSSASTGALPSSGGSPSTVKFAPGSKAGDNSLAPPSFARAGSLSASRSAGSLHASSGSGSSSTVHARSSSSSSALSHSPSPLSPESPDPASSAAAAASTSPSRRPPNPTAFTPAELAKQRARKKKLKEAREAEMLQAVMVQLQESRLDHVREQMQRTGGHAARRGWEVQQLHRWRNAFDGTKQRSDRLLIKKLVSRAEARQAALAGGTATLEPVVGAVLAASEQQGAGMGAARARSAGSSRRKGRKEEYTEADAYDEHAGLDEPEYYGATPSFAEGSTSHRSTRSTSAGASYSYASTPVATAATTDFADPSSFSLPSSSLSASYAASTSASTSSSSNPMAYPGSRRKHESGVQRRHTHVGDVILEEQQQEGANEEA